MMPIQELLFSLGFMLSVSIAGAFIAVLVVLLYSIGLVAWHAMRDDARMAPRGRKDRQ